MEGGCTTVLGNLIQCSTTCMGKTFLPCFQTPFPLMQLVAIALALLLSSSENSLALPSFQLSAGSKAFTEAPSAISSPGRTKPALPPLLLCHDHLGGPSWASSRGSVSLLSRGPQSPQRDPQKPSGGEGPISVVLLAAPVPAQPWRWSPTFAAWAHCWPCSACCKTAPRAFLAELPLAVAPQLVLVHGVTQAWCWDFAFALAHPFLHTAEVPLRESPAVQSFPEQWYHLRSMQSPRLLIKMLHNIWKVSLWPKHQLGSDLLSTIPWALQSRQSACRVHFSSSSLPGYHGTLCQKLY